MTNLSYRPLLALCASLCLAACATVLINAGPLALGFALFYGLCLVALTALRKAFHRPLPSKALVWLAISGLLVIALLGRDATVLYYLNLIGLVLTAVLAFASKMTTSLQNVRATRWLTLPWHLLGRTLASPFILSYQARIERDHPTIAVYKSVILGLLMATPLLFIFGGLLMSSDQRFDRLISQIFTLDLTEVMAFFWEACLYWPISAGLIFICVQDPKPIVYQATPTRGADMSMNGVQLIVILSSLCLLFLSYLFVQTSYFFGGDKLVTTTAGVTYSSYARDGFWQLVWVALGGLVVLMFSHWLKRNESTVIQNWVDRLCLFMVILILIVEGSAIHRMALYINQYGLTELRFYSSAFMVFIVLALVGFSVIVLKGRRDAFGYVIVRLCLLLILALNVVNPSAWITAHNLQAHPEVENGWGTSYSGIAALDLDAMPTLIQGSLRLSADDACKLKNQLAEQLRPAPNWRNWTLAYSLAQSSLHQWEVPNCQVLAPQSR